MDAHDVVRSDLLRLKWHVAALRFERALRKYSLALKAAFDPDQPRDEWGRWTDAGRDPDGNVEEVDSASGVSDITDVSAIERSPGRRGIFEAAMRLIDAFRKENGFEDLFGYSQNRTVSVTTIEGELIFGSSGRSPTFTSADWRDAERMRDTLIEKYPDVMNSENIGQMPNDALFHAEANVMLRAARRYGGSLAGKEFEVHSDRALCGSCRRVLPLLARELGSPTVTSIDKNGIALIVRNGAKAD